MSIASLAAADQHDSGYAVDVWLDITLQPMTKVWQGVGGHSNFFFSEHDAREASGAYSGAQAFKFAETLWRLAQVEPSRTLSYRQKIAEFVVDLPVDCAVGICQANIHLGSGSVFQYYIPDWESRLYHTGRTYRFQSKAY